MLTIRLPWLDPALGSPDAALGRNVLDLNQDFRTWLCSADFLQRLASSLPSEIRSLERRAQLTGDDVWRLYRAIRLTVLLGADLAGEGEALEAYLHLLATGPDWYFTNRRAWPVSPRPDEDSGLGEIGSLFLEFLRQRSGVLDGEIVIEDPAQLPFARILEQHLGRAEHQMASRDGEIHPLVKSTDAAARYFRQVPGRMLRVTWSPAGTVTPKIRSYVRALHRHGIPVALEFAPVTDVTEPDEFVFRAMDEVVKLEPFLARLTVRAANPHLSDIVTVQLEAELDDQRRLAPHRLRRVPVTPATRLQAGSPVIVESRYDLAELSLQCDPGRDSHPYRLGRGRPDPDAGPLKRSAKAAKFLMLPGCARALPVSDEDAAYSEAVEFFRSPRRAGEFMREYSPAERARVGDFLENLANLGVLEAR